MTPAAHGATTQATDEISSRLEKIQEAVKRRGRADGALGNRVAAAEAQTKSLGDSLSHCRAASMTLQLLRRARWRRPKPPRLRREEAKTAAQAGVSAATSMRLRAASQRLKAPSNHFGSTDAAQRTSSADDRAARVTVAAEALRATVERGAPYQAELAAVKSLGAERDAHRAARAVRSRRHSERGSARARIRGADARPVAGVRYGAARELLSRQAGGARAKSRPHHAG